MASFLILCQDIPSRNATAGMLLEARADGDFGAKEILPRFGRIHCPAIQWQVAHSRIGVWRRTLAYNNVVYDSPTDRYTFDLEASNASATLGAITELEAEPSIDKIGGTITGTTTNGVSVSVEVAPLIVKWIQSERREAQDASFTHISNVGGLHTFDLDYTGIAGHTSVARSLYDLGGTILAQNVETSIIRFEMSRTSAIEKAKKLLLNLSVELFPASWALIPSALCTLISNGGEMTVTAAQLTNNIKDLRI